MTLMSHRSITVPLLGVVFAVGCGGSPDMIDPPDVREPWQSTEVPDTADVAIVGVRIHETERDLPGLFEEWRALGVNTVFASKAVTSTGGFRALARKNGTGLFIIFPVFYAPEELSEDPELAAITASGEPAKKDWVEFACPSRTDFRNHRIEEARDIVRRLRPEGLNIEFIHHFVSWETEGPDRDPAALPETCYCVHCLQAFATFLGVPTFSIPPQPQRAAAWIKANAADTWVRFEVQTITSMAEEIADAVRDIDPEILISVNIVPWRRDEFDSAITRVAGQDSRALSGFVDYLSPMTYSFMLHRPPEWVASVVQDLDRVADCPVLPSIRVSPDSRKGAVFSDAEFEAALRAALESPSAGVILRSWDDIEADPERAEIIRRVVRAESSEHQALKR